MTTLAVSLRTARSRGERPTAPEANLSDADLRGAYLRGANLHWANLSVADLRGANLSGANLSDADLRGAYLRDAYLRDANLRGANLRGANLHGANLHWANLRGANLRSVGIIGLGETPSGSAVIFPTPDGWTMQVGCWQGSPDDLRALIATDEGWPEAKGAEVAHRRPYLEAILIHVDLITTEMSHLIGDLAAKWGAA